MNQPVLNNLPKIGLRPATDGRLGGVERVWDGGPGGGGFPDLREFRAAVWVSPQKRHSPPGRIELQV